MKAYIIEKSTNEQHEKMLKMHDWCVATFGKRNYFNDKWDIGWFSAADNLVKFTFYEEELATLFVLVFGNEITLFTDNYRHNK